MDSQRKILLSAGISSFLVIGCTGCELVATAYVEKTWVTEPHGLKPDLTTKFELKTTRLIGRDAKMAELRKAK